MCVSDAAGAQVMDTAAVNVERRPGSSTTGLSVQSHIYGIMYEPLTHQLTCSIALVYIYSLLLG